MAGHDPPPMFATPRAPGSMSRGGEIANFARLLGLRLMPWQQRVAEGVLELRPDGRPRFRMVVVTVPRQCGKSVLLLCAVLHRLMAWGRPTVVTYNAQGGVDASVFWRRHWDRICDAGLDRAAGLDFKRGIADTHMTAGRSLMRVLSSSPTAGHGMTLDMAVVDEAMAYVTDEREQALLPGMRTVPDGQFWIVSTAGDDASLWLRSKVDRGRADVAAGRRTSMAYFEWGAPETADIDDEDVWWAAIPALGHTVDVETIRLEREALEESEFRRACLNQWYVGAAATVIPWKVWRSVCVPRPGAGGVLDAVGGRVWLSVEAHPDRRSAVVVVCVSGWVEAVKSGVGVSWVADWVTEFARRRRARGVTVVGAKNSAVGAQIGLAEARGVDVDWRLWGQVAAACGRLYDAALESDSEPVVKVVRSDVLDAAMRSGRRKWVSGGWVWAVPDRESDGDVSAVMAAALAFDGWARAEEAPPARPPSVWSPAVDADPGADGRLAAEVAEWAKVLS